MKIEKLKLENFRCFERLELDLDSQYTVLVGINGAGKSTILDALAIALGAYLQAIDGIESNSIQPSDAHYKVHAIGSRIDVQEQYPVQVTAYASVEKKLQLYWGRSLNGKKNRTTYGDASEVIAYARELQEEIREGNCDTVLPMIAYYGTGRLWMQKRNQKNSASNEKKFNRQMGYIDCLSSASNDKQMLRWFEDMTYIQLQEGKPVPELEAVKAALRQCYLSSNTEIEDANVTYDVKSKELKITVYYKNGFVEYLPASMLSDGEKSIISLIADIAYRMALLNPNLLDSVLETPGIVLIDEIDMHLHPLWQKKIIGDLITIFPNVQFVVTTHSPSVLANVRKEHIRLLDHYELFDPQNNTYGRSVEDILREIMGVDVRPSEVAELLNAFDHAIDIADLDIATKYLEQLRKVLGNNAKEVIENQITLDLEMIGDTE